MMLPISVCLIAKNEEQHIGECLKRLKPLHCEIVLVDTGSTDHTVKIAAEYTDRIYHFDWINDFSAARNYAVSQASHDWILSIDCDEYLERIHEKELAGLMQRYPERAGRILLRNRFRQDGQPAIEKIRLSRFFHRQHYHFTGTIHEQVTRKPALPGGFDGTDGKSCNLPLSMHTFMAPVTILHVGYDGSEEEMQAKSLRNIALLQKELESVGPDAYLYYQLGQSCMRLKDYDRAYEWFNKGLSMDVEPGEDYVQSMVESYGYCLLNMKRFQEALQLENIYDTFAVRADFVFLMGLIYMNNALFAEAVEAFKKSATMEQYMVEGVNSYRAYYNIGVIYECTGHLKEAVKYYRMCGGFEPAGARLSVIGGKG